MAFDPLKEYSSGLRGAIADPRSDEIFADSILRAGGDPDGESVAHDWEFAGIGSGKLTATWMHVESQFPGCWPGPGQQRGDCVSWGVTRAALTSWACELAEGKPDEVTGVIEGKPEISRQGIENCVISSESCYWHRGYNSDGWSCSAAARVITGTSGLWIRRDYPELGLDLTKYSGSMAGKWGSRKPPSDVVNEGKKHLVRTATNVRGFEQVRDFLAAGYGVFFCSSLGWSNSRNEDGVSYPRGSWAHSQSWIGADERPETVRKYGEPLILVLNSWGRWNRGPRKVMGTNLMIPEGAYWTPASTINRCSGIALSNIAGWPPRKLRSYGAEGNI